MSKSVRALLPSYSSWIVLTSLLGFFVSERLLTNGFAQTSLRGLCALLVSFCFVQRWMVRANSVSTIRALAHQFLFCYALIALGGTVVVCCGQWRDWEGLLLAMGLFALFLGAVWLVALEFVAGGMREANYVETRRVNASARIAISVVFALVGLGGINYAMSQHDTRYDLSFGAPTKPSSATISLLQAASEPVEVYLFFARGSDVLSEVQDYFQALATLGAKLRVLDQAFDPQLAKELKVTANGYVAFRMGAATNKWQLGINVDTARRKLKTLDKSVREYMARVAKKKSTIYFTSGHGERSALSGSGRMLPGKNFRELVRNANAMVKDLGLAQGLGDKIPSDADSVVVFGPTTSFMPSEVRSLIDYVKFGGALMLLIDVGVEHGLDDLLATLGLELGTKPLCNEKWFLRKSYSLADHVLLATNALTSHESVQTLSKMRSSVALAFDEAGPLIKKKSASTDDGSKITFVVRSMPDTFVDLDGDFVFDKGDETRRVANLVAVVELSAEPDSSGRAVVVGDADVLGDTLIANRANALFGYELMGWLLRDSSLSGDVSADKDIPIQHKRDSDILWFYGTTFAAPGAVVSLGLLFVAMRRRRGRSRG